jgi:hypothetical protein
MPFLKSRKNLKNRRVSKRKQFGGELSSLWCVYVKANGHYYPVFLTKDKNRKDKYLHELKTKYVDKETPFGDHIANETRVAEISQDLSVPHDDYDKVGKVFHQIVRMNIEDYDEDTEVPELENITYMVSRDVDGLIYKVTIVKDSKNESHIKDGEQSEFWWGHVQWRIDSLIETNHWMSNS